MANTFKEAIEEMVNKRILAGEDPMDLFDELIHEANLVFGRYNLEYELGLATKEAKED
jgi:hypothetical protein